MPRNRNTGPSTGDFASAWNAAARTTPIHKKSRAKGNGGGKGSSGGKGNCGGKGWSGGKGRSGGKGWSGGNGKGGSKGNGGKGRRGGKRKATSAEPLPDPMSTTLGADALGSSRGIGDVWSSVASYMSSYWQGQAQSSGHSIPKSSLGSANAVAPPGSPNAVPAFRPARAAATPAYRHTPTPTAPTNDLGSLPDAMSISASSERSVGALASAAWSSVADLAERGLFARFGVPRFLRRLPAHAEEGEVYGAPPAPRRQ